jgi:hypothetical protein
MKHPLGIEWTDGDPTPIAINNRKRIVALYTRRQIAEVRRKLRASGRLRQATSNGVRFVDLDPYHY